jgi:transcriptional regulator with XRE-family HTH domain
MHQRITLIREELGLSYKEFGDKLHYSKSYICMLEKGNRKISEKFIRRLISEFYLNRNWLLHGEGPPRDEQSRLRRELFEKSLIGLRSSMQIVKSGEQQLYFNRRNKDEPTPEFDFSDFYQITDGMLRETGMKHHEIVHMTLESYKQMKHSADTVVAGCQNLMQSMTQAKLDVPIELTAMEDGVRLLQRKFEENTEILQRYLDRHNDNTAEVKEIMTKAVEEIVNLYDEVGRKEQLDLMKTFQEILGYNTD